MRNVGRITARRDGAEPAQPTGGLSDRFFGGTLAALTKGIAMTKLHQILALEKGLKSKREKVMTAAYQLFQKGAAGPFQGISRSYQPRDDDGENLPGEDNRVQKRVDEELRQVEAVLAELIDLTVTKDAANCSANGNITVDGTVLAADVPVTTLLSIEKLLVDIRTMAMEIPVLDPSFTWEFDEATDSYRSEVKQTTRTKKLRRSHVLYEATPEHPAQVEAYTEDVIVGDWDTIHFSGAVPATTRNAIITRLEELQKAVKIAREEANEADAPSVEIAAPLLDYIFTPAKS